jgi:penicillin amidase
VKTPARESCEVIAVSALNLALDRMTAVQGSADVRSWQWGKAHHVVFFHQPFDGDPALSQIFNRVAPNGGDRHTVNVASNSRWREYDQRHLALYRQIIDLDAFANSRWMSAPGQSGVLGSPYYDDRIEEWLRVDYRPMVFAETAVDGQATERIVLQP